MSRIHLYMTDMRTHSQKGRRIFIWLCHVSYRPKKILDDQAGKSVKNTDRRRQSLKYLLRYLHKRGP